MSNDRDERVLNYFPWLRAEVVAKFEPSTKLAYYK